MFAAMDGIYAKTGTKQTLGHRNMQKDIASWNGDLQQAAKALKNSTDIYEDFELNYETSNFYDIMNASKLGCSEDDILADIDAMNIMKLFMDIDENGIADSVAAYYRIAKKYRFRRFTLFMYTATMELEFDDRNPDAFKNLEKEIYRQFDLELDVFGNLTDFPYYYTPFLGNLIMTENMKSMPSYTIRKFLTQNFIKYLKANITCAEC